MPRTLASINKSYTDYGHNTRNVHLWVWVNGRLNIRKVVCKFDEFDINRTKGIDCHDRWNTIVKGRSPNGKLQGRIDHDEKIITMAGGRYENLTERQLALIEKLLLAKFPDYEIFVSTFLGGL